LVRKRAGKSKNRVGRCFLKRAEKLKRVPNIWEARNLASKSQGPSSGSAVGNNKRSIAQRETTHVMVGIEKILGLDRRNMKTSIKDCLCRRGIVKTREKKFATEVQQRRVINKLARMEGEQTNQKSSSITDKKVLRGAGMKEKLNTAPSIKKEKSKSNTDQGEEYTNVTEKPI